MGGRPLPSPDPSKTEVLKDKRKDVIITTWKPDIGKLADGTAAAPPHDVHPHRHSSLWQWGCGRAERGPWTLVRAAAGTAVPPASWMTTACPRPALDQLAVGAGRRGWG